MKAKGFNRHWIVPLRYGKRNYYGLEIINFKVEQTLRTMQFINKMLLHKNHQTLIQIIIECFNISAGLEYQTLEHPISKTNYINSIWVNDLIQFMTQYNIKILLTKNYFNVTSQRGHDKCIIKEC